jgi:tRNA nucleotidyltransferase/poly(A) polymerase
MHKYLVGGAVRDYLLGLPIKDRDWVVVGSTPQEMIQLGFKPVGKDFPVFLHPETHEEYALARTERKISKGYHGFLFCTDAHVTLEQDLERRDLTINAIAMDDFGKIIDPFNGQYDLKHKLLRHVSNAFVEDPVRLLRVARFSARYDFSIAKDTLVLMKDMVSNGEIHNLVRERVWQEVSKTLMCSYPEKFFSTLLSCGAWSILFPNFDEKFLYVEHWNKMNLDLQQRCALWCAASNNTDLWFGSLRLPKTITSFCKAWLHANTSWRDLSTSEKILDALLSVDAFRHEKRFYSLLSLWKKFYPYNQEAIILGDALRKLKAIDWKNIFSSSDSYDQSIPAASRVHAHRLEILKTYFN